MATKADNSTPVILRKLAKYVGGFYLAYYLLSIILVGGFGVPWRQLGRFPFRIRATDFSPVGTGDALGAWLAMVLTHTLCLGLTTFVVRVTKKAWDYVVTTALAHLVLCIIVNQTFPEWWVWWVTLGVSCGVLSAVAEVVNYYWHDMREIALDR